MSSWQVTCVWPALTPADRTSKLEYNSLSSLFTIRMPCGLHEILAECIRHEITQQLARAGEGDNDAAKFARSIDNLASSTLNLREFDSDSDSPNDPHPSRSTKVMRKAQKMHSSIVL